MTQDEIDRLALDAAYEQAVKSRSEGGIPIGSALVTRTGVVVALGHNLRVQTRDPTAHAETACMRDAGRRRIPEGWRAAILSRAAPIGRR